MFYELTCLKTEKTKLKRITIYNKATVKEHYKTKKIKIYLSYEFFQDS